MPSLLRRVACALAVALACAPITVAAQATAPEPHAVTDVIVRPGDLIRVKLWPEQQYSGDYTVETTGIVAIPLLGEIPVAGQALEAVRDTIRNRYRTLTTNGVAIVSLQFRVSVLGEVGHPGLFSVDATQTVFDALSQAGGASSRADLSHIRLLRNDRVIVLNGTEAMETGSPMLGVLLESGDRIIVPQKPYEIFTLQNALTALQTIGLIIALARHP